MRGGLFITGSRHSIPWSIILKPWSKRTKKIGVVVRVNVDRENSNEYHTICRYLSDKFGERVRVHAGFVDNYTFACRSAESCNLDRRERAKFLVDQYARHGIYSDRLYPRLNHDSCMARHINSFAVDPDGDLYKCLSLVGVKEMAVGNVNNNARYWTTRTCCSNS